VLADTLRTDRARLHPLTRDSDATLSLRMSVRARKDLIAARVAMANQLRAHLQTTLPGAIDLFRDIDSQITLAFLRRFPSQDKVDWLSKLRFGNWLASIGYNHRANLDRLWVHLHDAPRGTTGTEAAPRAQITLALVAALSAIREQIHALDTQIEQQLAAHPDAAIFTSLPRAGTNRAARLLAETGDARGRFPTPEALTRNSAEQNARLESLADVGGFRPCRPTIRPYSRLPHSHRPTGRVAVRRSGELRWWAR
jgi:transposase